MTDAEIAKLCREWPNNATQAARAIIAAHTAKLLAGVEMPEPTIIKDMDWCENEVYDIGDLQQYAAAAAAQARVKALDEAKGVCLDMMAPPSVGGIANANLYHDATEDCAAAIDRLKGGE